jgi:hypothetical protein
MLVVNAKTAGTNRPITREHEERRVRRRDRAR